MRLSKTHRAMVAALMDARDDDLPNLLKLSGLDPKTELVGADFRGMDFSGIDLADYNLSRCNLSGADLRKAVNVDRAMFADVIDTGTLWPNRLRSRPGSEAARTLDIEPAMIAIAPGRFIMGATDAEHQREKVLTQSRSWEQPCVEVAVDRPFLLGRYPVTVGEFRRFVQETTSSRAAPLAGSRARAGNSGRSFFGTTPASNNPTAIPSPAFCRRMPRPMRNG